MNNIMQGKDIPILGDGEQTRAFSYIKDVAPLIAQSVKKNECYNQIFNIGANKYYTINELADEVMNSMNKRVNKNYFPARKEVVHAYSDHSKLRKYFGKQTVVPLKVGLKKMADWAKEIGIKKSKKFKQIEIYKNLPEIWQ